MPLARIASNKQLFPVELTTPGNLGLNSEQASSILPAGWATDALNGIIDTDARLAAREGLTTVSGGVYANLALNLSGTGTVGPYIAGQGTQVVVTAVTNVPATTLVVGMTVHATGGVTYRGVVSSIVGAVITYFIPENVASGIATGPLLIDQPATSLFEGNFGTAGYQLLASYFQGIVQVQPSGAYGGNIIGTAPIVAGRWFFQNFNNKVIGFKNGQTPIVYTGTGSFAPIVASGGTVPTGGIGCAAFGRVWTVQNDLQTIQYSGLLDETDWGSSDSGVIDMHTVWSNGTDTVQAIFAFNSSLVVCGLKHIVFYTDGRGSLLGMDPTQAYVYDIITGTGCVSQFSVQPMGQSDVLFLSPVGVQSLARLVTNDNNPLATVTKYNRSLILEQLQNEVPINISSCFDPLQGFYLLSFPVTGVVWCLDTRRPFVDQDNEQVYRTTYWDMTATALATTHTPTTYIARTANQVAIYGGGTALDELDNITFNWLSPWLQLDPQISERLKLLKRYNAMVVNSGLQTVTFNWNTDFGIGEGSASVVITGVGGSSMYGLGQYGVDDYGGATNLAVGQYPAHARGQYYQLGLNAVLTGAFAIQQVQAAFKIGRIA